MQERELPFDSARNNIYMSLNLSVVNGIYKLKSLTVFELAASEAWLNFFTLSLSAQMERQMNAERIKRALQAKKALGGILGRPIGVCCIDDQKADIIEYIEKGFNIMEVAVFIGCSCQTLSKWLVQNKNDPDIQRALIKALIKESKAGWH
jgi:DNA invertase Pin-like site-specific DNA recombinase